MKRLISTLLAAVMVISMLACGAGTALADEPASVTIEASDVDLQLSLIYTQVSKLEQKDDANTWYYSVTDLDHDGNLEFVAATTHPQDRSTNLKVWEISEDRKSLTECKLDKDEDESFPDIMTDCADTFHDAETDTWSYLFYDNIVISDQEVYTIKTGVNLKDGVIDYDAYAIEHTVQESTWRNISYTDANGLPISPDQYNAAGHNAFAGAERSSTSFQWMTEKDLDSVARVIDSYAVFSGTKLPTEVFPVPRPAVIQNEKATPTPAVTPSPAATPVPSQEVKYLAITKNPTNENRKAKDTALFVACANAFESLSWTLVSPNGGEYSVASFKSAFPNVKVTGEYSTTLSIANLDANLNGWGAYCTFYYRGQTARTTTGYIYIKNAPTPLPDSGSMSGTVLDFAGSTIAIEVPGVDIFKLGYSDCIIYGDIYIGAPAVVYYNGRYARGVYVTGATITGSDKKDGGTYYGTVTEWNYSYVSVNLDGTTIAAIPWDVCVCTGDIYVGAPATAVWQGTTTKGLNFTYCSIEGRQPEPQPIYGSMSGTAHEGGGGFAIDLADGSQVFIDGWKCNVSGQFYDGASCTVYYTNVPDEANIYQVDIYGSTYIDPVPKPEPEPEPYVPEPEPYVPEPTSGSISGTAFKDSDSTAVLYLDNGDTVYVGIDVCNQIGELVYAGGGNSCVAYYYDYPNAMNIYSVDIYPAQEN